MYSNKGDKQLKITFQILLNTYFQDQKKPTIKANKLKFYINNKEILNFM